MAKRTHRSAQASHAIIHALIPNGSVWDPLGEGNLAHTRGRDDVHRDRSYIRRIRPHSDNQRTLMKMIDDYNLVLALGPAGTGKTYIAIAKAVEALESGSVGRIILSRPAVEAGESLGFLPGSLEDKLAPYLRPFVRCFE